MLLLALEDGAGDAARRERGAPGRRQARGGHQRRSRRGGARRNASAPISTRGSTRRRALTLPPLRERLGDLDELHRRHSCARSLRRAAPIARCSPTTPRPPGIAGTLRGRGRLRAAAGASRARVTFVLPTDVAGGAARARLAGQRARAAAGWSPMRRVRARRRAARRRGTVRPPQRRLRASCRWPRVRSRRSS